ncbi:hypothetical protein [Actinokineospora terrae]|uniref:Tryptophan-associated transmembrane protein (Trp_oprn_chp) n=1 Tax=Actinokineospora terrae TaxID=155974 RepID=A0A1H9QC59_9PSEU|nr:hypothetical protein [Actinokineospora terrae]SER58008.1 hypothetical protein SAMN04487818_104180 [Actinokineospora terrae]
MANFDPKRVTPIEWAGIGAGALAFIFSFFSWYSVSYNGPSGLGFAGFDQSASAWSLGIGGWLPVLLLVAAAVILVLPHVGTAVPNLVTIWLGLAAAAVVILLIRWLTLPSASSYGLDDSGISVGAGFGLYLGLVAAIVSAVAAGLAFTNSRKTVPPQAPPAPGYPA